MQCPSLWLEKADQDECLHRKFLHRNEGQRLQSAELVKTVDGGYWPDSASLSRGTKQTPPIINKPFINVPVTLSDCPNGGVDFIR